MKLTFYKYQGTGNDFVILDNRQEIFPKNDTKLVARLCDRKFGIGADGLMLLETSATTDFTMVYYNADGNLSTMCGNGGRCLVAFAEYLGVFSNKTTFEAIDGLHEASIDGNIVNLKMIDVENVIIKDDYAFANTGSPHHVQLVDSIENFDVFTNGRKIRNEIYGIEGSNVNFVEQKSDTTFRVRTYERGVEDETLACGTGVTAVALAMHKTKKTESTNINLEVEGGELAVSFTPEKDGYTNVYLKGPAVQVFKGIIDV